MNGRFLLDTNIIIGIFSGNAEILNNFANASESFAPSIAIGELYYGAHKSSKNKDNFSKIEEFANTISVISCDESTAKIYGGIKYRLKEKGNPIPENDLWIAAVAIQHDLTLVTRDAHFLAVDELKTAEWR
ncbi:MAG: type II toxin-antitoxin system VapC family toxin [Nitrospinae bacterium]|nr:type II toxin-antitoxin system VapC family toxin [Nitrospinota bacterium]